MNDPTRLCDDASQPEGLRLLLQQGAHDLGTKAQMAEVFTKLAPLVGGAAMMSATTAANKTAVSATAKWWLLAGAGVIASAVAFGVAKSEREGLPGSKQGGVPATGHDLKPETGAEFGTVPGSAERDNAGSEVKRGTVEQPLPASEPRRDVGNSVQVGAAELPRKAEKPEGNAPAAKASDVPLKSSAALPTAREPVVSESQLLSRAQSELSKNPSLALKLAREHAERFPQGLLVQERQIISIEALARLGNTAEAEKRARAFLARNPGSMYERRARAVLSSTSGR